MHLACSRCLIRIYEWMGGQKEKRRKRGRGEGRRVREGGRMEGWTGYCIEFHMETNLLSMSFKM